MRKLKVEDKKQLDVKREEIKINDQEILVIKVVNEND